MSTAPHTFAIDDEYSHPIGNAELYLEARYALARSYERRWLR